MKKKALILVPVDFNANEYLQFLKNQLDNYFDISISVDFFFNINLHYDLIIFNFLIFLQDSGYSMDIIESRLEDRKNRGELFLYIRHDSIDLFNIDNVEQLRKSQKFYDYISCVSDYILHLGQFSIDDFKHRYPQNKTSRHYIVLHPLYTRYESSNKKHARRALGLKEKGFYFFVPGHIRSKEEMKISLEIFKQSGIRNKYLIFNRIPRVWFSISSGKFYSRYVNYIYRIAIKYINHIHLNDRYMKDEEMSLFFSACDFVVIPRKFNLNSGNVILGAQFNKALICYPSGNMKAMVSQLKQILYIDNLSITKERLLKVLKENEEISLKQRVNDICDKTIIRNQFEKLINDILKELK